MPFKVKCAYLILCTFLPTPKRKFAICVDEEKPLFFFINSEPRKHFDISSQLKVKPAELPFLSYDSYINTADVVTCVVPVSCYIEQEYGEIPADICAKIKETVAESYTLSPRFITNITANM